MTTNEKGEMCTSGLHADETVLHNVDPTHAVLAAVQVKERNHAN